MRIQNTEPRTDTADEESRAVRAIQNIAALPGVNYGAIAVATGTSPATVRVVLLTGRLPTRPNSRRALLDFAARNAAARDRRDLVFV